MDAIPSRMQWDGRAGFVRHDGVQVSLPAPPHGWHVFDYAPGCVASVQPRACDPPRDMYATEVQWCEDTMRRVAAGARRSLAFMLGDIERDGSPTVPATLDT